jgi:hypothetical protein
MWPFPFWGRFQSFRVSSFKVRFSGGSGREILREERSGFRLRAPVALTHHSIPVVSQGLKPVCLVFLTARLKPCPSTNRRWGSRAVLAIGRRRPYVSSFPRFRALLLFT